MHVKGGDVSGATQQTGRVLVIFHVFSRLVAGGSKHVSSSSSSSSSSFIPSPSSFPAHWSRTWISGLAETLRQRHPKAELLLSNAEESVGKCRERSWGTYPQGRKKFSPLNKVCFLGFWVFFFVWGGICFFSGIIIWAPSCPG